MTKWKSSFDHSSMPANQLVTSLFTEYKYISSIHWLTFIPVQYKLGHPYSTVHHNHISRVFVCVCVCVCTCIILRIRAVSPIPYYLLTTYSVDHMLMLSKYIVLLLYKKSTHVTILYMEQQEQTPIELWNTNVN